MARKSRTNGGLQRQRICFHLSWNPTQAEKRAVDQSRTSASSLARTSADASLHNYLVVSPLGGHLDFSPVVPGASLPCSAVSSDAQYTRYS